MAATTTTLTESRRHRLASVLVRGFLSLDDVVFTSNPCTVLIGANGAGKSNVVSVFELLAASVEGELQPFVFTRFGGARRLLFDGADRDSLDLGLDITSGEKALRYDITLTRTVTDEFFVATERVTEVESGAIHNCREDVQGVSRREAVLALPPAQLREPLSTVADWLRGIRTHHFHDTSLRARFGERWSVNDDLALKRDGGNLAPVLARLRRKHPAHYQRIVTTLKLIAPFFGDFVLEADGDWIQLRWRETGSDLVFSAHQASDGTLRAMALVTLLLQPVDELPSLLVLDEPELGLHPYAIGVIAGLVRAVSHDCQVILATQSTTLIDHFEAEDIVVVEREGRASTFRRLDADELGEWLDEYTLSELWEKNVLGGRPSR